MNFTRSVKRKAKVNITPLIDIVFLLLVFFMLSSEYMVTEAVNLTVSGVKGGKEDKGGQSVVIVLNPGGNFTMDNADYKIDRLREKLLGSLQDNKDRKVIVLSQDGVTVQDVVFAMDNIKATGANNVLLAQFENAAQGY